MGRGVIDKEMWRETLALGSRAQERIRPSNLESGSKRTHLGILDFQRTAARVDVAAVQRLLGPRRRLQAVELVSESRNFMHSEGHRMTSSEIRQLDVLCVTLSLYFSPAKSISAFHSAGVFDARKAFPRNFALIMTNDAAEGDSACVTDTRERAGRVYATGIRLRVT
ncbi:hypothetical protein EVAR_6199_1 [Eumeta japonica]|uniref:Uncharacterized protein n=1 Tax=Eumeta variegata TaxID=151549 RepID=A0A4C2A5I0_EUMVA|nr:hypothetical protein EVAR_6199_1 [Eumeta japonica]